MIITYHRAGKSIDMEIDDKHCDRLLDDLSDYFQTPNAQTDARWHAMMAKRVAIATPAKKRSR